MSRQQRRRDRRRDRRGAGQGQSKWLLWAVGGVAGAVLIVAFVLYAAGVFSSESRDLSSAQVDEFIEASHLIGEPSAPVTLIEFADFQCPFCRDFWDTTLRAVKNEFIDTGEAALYFHHMAFLGPESELAAQASECAAEQGRFDDYFDILFLQQGQENEGYLSQGTLESFASAIQMDVPAFSECLTSGKYLAKVRADTARANKTGINSTPTLVVNGNFIENPLNVTEVREAIQSALDEAG